MTSLTSAKRSLPPSSAGEDCLHYGRSSTKIIGVCLDLQSDRRRGNDVMFEAVFLAIADCGFLGRKVDAHLRVGVARPVPACQRIRPLRLLPFEFQQPVSGIRLARLR